jgi:hypothetical protein
VLRESRRISDTNIERSVQREQRKFAGENIYIYRTTGRRSLGQKSVAEID